MTTATLTPTETAINDLWSSAARTTRFAAWGVDAFLLDVAQMDVSPIDHGIRIGGKAMKWAAELTESTVGDLFSPVKHERARQEREFPMPDGFPKRMRMAILVEEIGEVAEAWLDVQRDSCEDNRDALFDELVQVAAVCARWVEVARSEATDAG